MRASFCCSPKYEYEVSEFVPDANICESEIMTLSRSWVLTEIEPVIVPSLLYVVM